MPSNHGDLTGIYVENRFVYGLRSGRIPPGMKLPGPVPDDDGFKLAYTKEDTEAKRTDPMDLDAPKRVNDRVMPVLTDKAVRWIGQQKSGAPFFLYFTPVAVHSPVTPAKDMAGRSAAGLFGDWIQELDRSVGRVLDALDKQGLAKETLVIFSSDNGGVREPQRADRLETVALNAGLAVNGPWRGGKHHIWEGGFKVPFVVRWPGKAPAGTVCDTMVSLADILATTAAVVGDKLPAAGKAAEDSFNILPAILGEPGEKPPRQDMVVHSADGVFGIRKGPWKWIEGVPVDEIRAGVRKANAAEYRAQLYNVKEDPAETTDVIAAHPGVARELEGLLDRYRDGGFSRELPPVVAKGETRIELPPLGGSVVLNEAMDKVPGAPWVQVRGKWVAKDGVVWGTEKPVDQVGAAMRSPLALTDGDIQYELCLAPANAHVLRLQCQKREHVFLVQMSARRLVITRQPAEGDTPGRSLVMAQERVKFKPGAWLPVRVCCRTGDLIVRVADVTVKAYHAFLKEPKIAFALMAQGENVGFRKMVVTADRKPASANP